MDKFNIGDIVWFAPSGGGLDYGAVISNDDKKWRPYTAIAQSGRTVNRPTDSMVLAVENSLSQDQFDKLQKKVSHYLHRKCARDITIKYNAMRLR